MPKSQLFDKESEQALLAAIMLDQRIFKNIDLTIDDFYIKQNQKIYQVICELIEDGVEPEEVSIFSKIRDKGWTGDVPATYLAGLGTEISGAVTQNWKSYVSVIKQKSAARQLIVLAENLNRLAKNGSSGMQDKINEAIGQLSEIRDKSANKARGLTEEIKEWILTTSGNFQTTDVYNELGVTTRDNKKKVATILGRLEQENVIVRCGAKRGCYRALEKDAPVIDFLNVNLNDPYPIKWPFGIEKYVDLYPGNVVVIAGQANAGKTAFCLNVVKENMRRHKIEYFSSEMGPEEFHLRLRKFSDLNLKDWHFSPRQRSSNFADVIVPDSLNIIDYLEVTEDFYKVGGQIKGIFDRLRKGIAIICLQKKEGTDIGRGGDFTLEKPRLYMSMQPGELKIVKGKNWASEFNPNGMIWKFKLIQGCRFLEAGGSVYDL